MSENKKIENASAANIKVTEKEKKEIEYKLREIRKVLSSYTPVVADEDLNRLRELVVASEGKMDPRSLVRIVQSPENLESTTYLKPREVKAVALGIWFVEQWPWIAEPLLDYLYHLLNLKISEKGRGRQDIINVIAAEAKRKETKVRYISESGQVVTTTSQRKKPWWKFWGGEE